MKIKCSFSKVVELEGTSERYMRISVPDLDRVEHRCREAVVNILREYQVNLQLQRLWNTNDAHQSIHRLCSIVDEAPTLFCEAKHTSMHSPSLCFSYAQLFRNSVAISIGDAICFWM